MFDEHPGRLLWRGRGCEAMDQTLSALVRPRHLLATLLIAVLLGGGVGGLVGLARAQDPQAVAATLPPPFVLASPAAGDRGRYVLEHGPTPLTDEQRRAGFEDDRAYTVDFALGGFEVQHDEAGAPHWAQRIELATYEQRGDWNRSENQHGWAVDGRVIAQWREDVGEPDVRQEGGVLPTQSGQSTSQTTWRSLTFGDMLLPCGLFDALQGSSPPAPGTLLEGAPTCAWGAGPHDPNKHWTYYRGLNESGFLVVDYYRTHPADRPNVDYEPDWRAYYRADIPYPAAMWNSWSAFGAPGDTLRLVGFDRGTGLQEPPALPLPPPLPVPVNATRPVWTLDDAGVEHPFPLSAAFAYVRDDPTHPGLRDFLADHPDAYVHWARHAEFDVDGQHSHRWSFELTDGAARHQEVISQDVANSVSVAPGLPGFLPTMTYSYETADHNPPYGEQPLIAPDRLPARTPTVASLLAVWAAMPAMSGNDDAASSWEFQVVCDEDCGNVSLAIGAGQVYYYRISEPGYPVVDNRMDVWDTSELWWNDGQLSHGIESDQVSVRQEEALIQPPGAAPEPETAEASLGPAPTPAWLPPTTAQAVGIGIGAGFAALLYWLWPLAKGGGVGLFSRVHKDRLLDNPLRSHLVQRIEAEPGVHHNALVRELGKGKGTAEHHLEKLVAGGLVLRHRSPGYTCYFPVGTDRRAMAASPATKADGARRILQAVSQGLGGVREIAQSTGLAPSTVSHHLERLRAAGLVIGDGRVGYSAVQGPGSAAQAAA